jgi:hypothetical protein
MKFYANSHRYDCGIAAPLSGSLRVTGADQFLSVAVAKKTKGAYSVQTLALRLRQSRRGFAPVDKDRLKVTPFIVLVVVPIRRSYTMFLQRWKG